MTIVAPFRFADPEDGARLLAGLLQSPYASMVGIEIEELADGRAMIACALGPQHRNGHGIVHGGVPLAMLDMAGGGAGIWSPEGPVASVTVNLNVQFCGPILDSRLVATGSIIRRGGLLFFSQSEIRNADGSLVASASSVHRVRSRDSRSRGEAKA